MNIHPDSALTLTGDDLFRSCCKGNLARVRYLVEKMEYDPNVRDRWDSTPLYYACLCGHKDLVVFLLEHGARCEALTFDGERCFYAAINDEIRNILKGAKGLHASKKQRDEFEDFTEKLLKCEEYSDIEITIKDESFKLHKCILKARSQLFKNKLSKSSVSKMKIGDQIGPRHFEELVNFMYTGKFTCSKHDAQALVHLINLLGIKDLEDYLQKEMKADESYGASKTAFKTSTCVIGKERSRKELTECFKTIFKPGLPHKYQKLIDSTLKSPKSVDYVQEDLKKNSEEYESDTTVSDCDESSFNDDLDSKEINSSGFDVCFQVDSMKFYAHKLFLCSRSAYLETLIRSPLTEFRERNSPIETYEMLEVNADVFTAMLNYIYTGRQNTITDKNVVDVMVAADYFIIPGLKKQCSDVLITWTKPNNVFKMLRLAKTFSLSKLEDFCFHIIASAWNELRHSEDLKSMIIEYASEIKSRHLIDSIEIIDEVRYHISMKKSEFLGTRVQEVDAKIAEELKQVDELLMELGLEA